MIGHRSILPHSLFHLHSSIHLHWIFLAFGAALLALPSSPSLAQVPGLIHLGAGGGRSFPSGDSKDALESGLHGQAMVAIDVPSIPLGLRGCVTYERFDLNSALGIDDGKGSVLGATANGLLFFPKGVFHPYLTAGVGTYRVKSDLPRSDGDSDSEVSFGINGGVGFELRFLVVRAFAEAKVENIQTDRGLRAGSGGSTRIIPVTIGVIF